MDYGKLVEMKLAERGMGKRELYDMIKSLFYDGPGEKYISAPAFNTRIAENKISAEDMGYMAVILDIDLMQIQKKIVKVMESKKQRVSSHIKELMKMSSMYYKEGCKVEFASTNEAASYKNDRFYMICVNTLTKDVSMEIFDFDSCTVKTLITLDMSYEWQKSVSFDNFIELSVDEKLTFLLNKKKEFEVLLGELGKEDIHSSDEMPVHIPTLRWNLDFGDIDFESVASMVEQICGEGNLDEFMNKFTERFKQGVGFGCENKVEVVDVEGVVVRFKIISSRSHISDGIDIYNKVKIISVVKNNR